MAVYFYGVFSGIGSFSFHDREQCVVYADALGIYYMAIVEGVGFVGVNWAGKHYFGDCNGIFARYADDGDTAFSWRSGDGGYGFAWLVGLVNKFHNYIFRARAGARARARARYPFPHDFLS